MVFILPLVCLHSYLIPLLLYLFPTNSSSSSPFSEFFYIASRVPDVERMQSTWA